MALLKRRRLHTHGNDNFSLYTLANKPHCIFLRSLNLKCAAWHICDPTVPWSPLVRRCGSARLVWSVGSFSTERCHASDHKWQFSLGYGLSWHPPPTTSVCSRPYSRLLSLTMESSKQAGVRAVHRSYRRTWVTQGMWVSEIRRRQLHCPPVSTSSLDRGTMNSAWPEQGS